MTKLTDKQLLEQEKQLEKAAYNEGYKFNSNYLTKEKMEAFVFKFFFRTEQAKHYEITLQDKRNVLDFFDTIDWDITLIRGVSIFHICVALTEPMEYAVGGAWLEKELFSKIKK